MKPHRPSTPALWLTALTMGLLTLGCEQAPPPIEGKIRIVDPGRPAEVEGAGPLLPDSNPVKWLSRRVSVQLEQPLDEPWEAIDETVLNELSRAAWNGNGLRVGVMSAARVPTFASALGKTFEERDTQLVSYNFLEEIRESPPLRAEFTADLTVPPNPVTIETFTRGRLRMLMSSQPLGNGFTRVTLAPQHYRPRITLLPKSLEDRIRDGRDREGRVFEELSIQLDLGPRDVLVLGYYRPAPIQPTDVTENDTENPSDQESQGPAATESELIETEAETEIEVEDQTPEEAVAEPLPVLSLGIGLFTTGLTEDDLQYLYLLRPLP